MKATPPRRFTFEVATEGNTEVVNLIPHLQPHSKSLEGDGVLHLFVIGSTAALTTVEFEPGLVKHDIAETMQRLVPDNIAYRHELTWHDDNGHSHVRAAMLGPSLTLPFTDGKLITGDYQQPVLIDFDTRPRRRKIIGTVL